MLRIGVFRSCLRWAGAVLASAGTTTAMATTASQAQFELLSIVFFEASCSADGQFQATDAWMMYFMPQLILVLALGMMVLLTAYAAIWIAREGRSHDLKVLYWPWLRLNWLPAVVATVPVSGPAILTMAYIVLTGRIDPVNSVMVTLGQCTSATSFTLTQGWGAFFIAMVILSFPLAWLLLFRTSFPLLRALERHPQRKIT